MSGIDPITAIGNATDTLLSIVNKFVPDKDQAARLSNEIQTTLINQIGASDTAQAGTNTAEAGSRSMFVSGWRRGPIPMWPVLVLADRRRGGT